MSGSKNGLIARYPTLAVGLTCIDKQNNAAGIHLPKSVGQYSGAEAAIGRLVGHSRDSVTGRYIDAVDTLLVMAADTVAGFIKGLLGVRVSASRPMRSIVDLAKLRWPNCSSSRSRRPKTVRISEWRRSSAAPPRRSNTVLHGDRDYRPTHSLWAHNL